MDEKLLEKYAAFAVQTALNLQKGETLFIAAPIEGAFFARMCAEAGYAAGARDVVVVYEDEQLSRIRMQHTAVEVLEDVKPWILQRYMDYAKGEGGMSFLRIMARDPEVYKGLDTAKIERASQASNKALHPFRQLTITNQVKWSIVAIPSDSWAAKIFPGEDAATAREKLWQAIFKTARVEGGDPVGEWEKHTASLREKREWLQSLNLSALRLESANGTDLMVGLADDHVWQGGDEPSSEGVPFLANVPTEEVFTAPHCRRTNGVVKSSLPYVYNGNLIEGITVRFENGYAVEYSAEKGDELLQQMLSSDEGAKRIGEIALVPATSPIRQTGLLFYNTLFDENAACHMAFGQGYPGTVKGGEEMSVAELLEKGVNDSLIHEDIMIGTADMNITGITKSGETVAIFTNGVWAKG